MFNQLEEGVVREVAHGRLPVVQTCAFATDNGLDLLHVTVESLKISQFSVFLLRAADVQQQFANLTPDVRSLMGHHVLAQNEVPFLKEIFLLIFHHEFNISTFSFNQPSKQWSKCQAKISGSRGMIVVKV